MIYSNLKHYNTGKILFFNFRKKRSTFVKSIIKKIYDENGQVKIIDLGGTDKFWSIYGYNFLKSHNVKITLVNLIKLEISNSEIFELVNQNIFKYKFPKNKYDLCFSNSVIEHVGGIDQIKKFSKIHTLYTKYYYCQTPNKYFIIEPHYMFPFFNFLPLSFKLFLVSNFKLGNISKTKNKDKAIREINSINLLSEKEMKSLFINTILIKEKFLFMNKSFIATNFK